MFDGLYQSVIVFFMAYLLYRPGTFLAEAGPPVTSPGQMGIYVGTAAVVVVNAYILMNMYRWDYATLFVATLSILFFVGWTGIYTSFTSSAFFYGGATEVFGTLSFWCQTLLTIVICLAPRFCIKAYQKIYRPRDVDIVREQVRQGRFKHLDDADPSSPSAILGKGASPSSISTDSDPKSNGNAVRQMSEDQRPFYPPSVAPTATTRNPHSTQGSDDSTAPQPVQNRASFDKPRISLDRPRPSFDRPRPSYDRVRSSMEQIRPSFESSRDMTTASYLSRIESSSNTAVREPSRLRE